MRSGLLRGPRASYREDLPESAPLPPCWWVGVEHSSSTGNMARGDKKGRGGIFFVTCGFSYQRRPMASTLRAAWTQTPESPPRKVRLRLKKCVTEIDYDYTTRICSVDHTTRICSVDHTTRICSAEYFIGSCCSQWLLRGALMPNCTLFSRALGCEQQLFSRRRFLNSVVSGDVPGEANRHCSLIVKSLHDDHASQLHALAICSVVRVFRWTIVMCLRVVPRTCSSGKTEWGLFSGYR